MIFRVPAFPMVRELYWTGEVGKWNDHSISVPQITVANIAAVVCISTHWCDSWLPLDISLYYRPDFYCNIYGKTRIDWKDLCVTVHKKGPQYLLSSVQLQIFPAKVPETAAPRQVLSPCINMTTSAVTICQILFPIDKRYDKSKLSR